MKILYYKTGSFSSCVPHLHYPSHSNSLGSQKGLWEGGEGSSLEFPINRWITLVGILSIFQTWNSPKKSSLKIVWF